ncbi:MAG: 2-methylcitrate dehydratase [Syntrophorhabdus sp. PtaU1.Bin058]|nr:MAG: 2-methylcitrate dehydratase [Syntrophorhabdus sp. PtaU1.Bin058]
MGLAGKIAEYIVEADLSRMPAELIEKGKYCILDGIGCGLYGLEFEATKILIDLAQEWNGRPEASILGARVKVPSAAAAKVNGVAVHVADFDDVSTHLRGHPTAVVLPPALALCESRLKSGRDLLLAYIIGIEVGGKLGKVMGWSHYGAGWHGTGTIGTIAAAAASAKVLGLDETKTAHALAIAVSGASGIRENFGTMVKSLHAGQASAVGVFAALLAERGFVGSPTAFEGKSGFWRVYSGEHEIGRWVDELHEPSTLMELMCKRYPSCTVTHPALDVLEDLARTDPFSWKDVEEITCFITPLNASVLVYPRPINGLEAKFSLPYCVAAFLVHGKLDLSHFEKEALDDQRVRQLMEKIKTVPDENLGELTRTKDLLAPTDIQIRLKNRTISKRMLEARGSASSPLPNTEILEKFRVCAGRILSTEKVGEAIDLILSLESLPNVTTLMEVLAP